MARRKSSTRSTKQGSSKGLGDTVEKITTKTGIKKVVDWFSKETGVDCGCDKRKEKLNELFPYKAKNKIECLREEEYEFLKANLERRSWGAQVKNRITEIHARVFNIKVKYTGCASCIRGKIQELQAVMSAYEQA